MKDNKSNSLLIRDMNQTTMDTIEKVKDYTKEKTQTKAVLSLLQEFESLIKIKYAYYNLTETHQDLINSISEHLEAENDIRNAIKNIPEVIRSNVSERY